MSDAGSAGKHFLAGERTLGEAARVALLEHAWPGNVRELKNIIQRANIRLE